MARTGWRLVDTTASPETYVWPVNPREDSGSNAITKSITYSANAATRRTASSVDTIDTVIYQRNVDQSTISYTGYVYTQDEYDALEYWGDKQNPVELYDDLGRGLLIYITSIEFTRVRSRQNPYKHDYRFNAIILERL